MLKLLKYEFRKTRTTKAVILAITAIAEVAFLIGLFGNYDVTAAISVLTLVFITFAGILIIGIESVLTLHRDMTTKQSYMLFMTPNSCYKILGAKMLECSLSILIAGAFFFALGALDITLVFAREDMLGEVWRWIQETLSEFTINGRPIIINVQVLASTMFGLLAEWIFTITTAYLAIVISAALLGARRFNGLLSFVLFCVLVWGCARLVRLVTGGIVSSVALMAVSGALLLVLAVVMYFVTAQIMERKLSV